MLNSIFLLVFLRASTMTAMLNGKLCFAWKEVTTKLETKLLEHVLTPLKMHQFIFCLSRCKSNDGIATLERSTKNKTKQCEVFLQAVLPDRTFPLSRNNDNEA